jgi:hypothetical protein
VKRDLIHTIRAGGGAYPEKLSALVMAGPPEGEAALLYRDVTVVVQRHRLVATTYRIVTSVTEHSGNSRVYSRVVEIPGVYSRDAEDARGWLLHTIMQDICLKQACSLPARDHKQSAGGVLRRLFSTDSLLLRRWYLALLNPRPHPRPGWLKNYLQA